MAEFKPHEYKKGDIASHEKLNESDRAIASLNPVSGDGVVISKSIQGTAISATEQTSVVGFAAFITVAITPCNGAMPNFQFGSGSGILLNLLSDGTTTSTGRTITIYNSLPQTVPTGDWPVQLKMIGSLYVVDVAACSENS
jgi:hypothetical protein